MRRWCPRSPKSSLVPPRMTKGRSRHPTTGPRFGWEPTTRVESIDLILRSGTDPATIGRVVEFAALLGTRALDTQTGEFLTADGGAASHDQMGSLTDPASLVKTATTKPPESG